MLNSSPLTFIKTDRCFFFKCKTKRKLTLQLIKIYMYICYIYPSSQFYCQRFSNNVFTDQGLLAVYLFCEVCRRYFEIKEIHTFTKEYLLSWFSNLASIKQKAGFNY